MKPQSESKKQSAAFPKFLAGIALLALLGSTAGLLPAPARAESAEEIQAKIAEQNAKIAALEKEIAEYEKTLTQIGGQKNTLQGEVNRIDVSRKKISADISVTQNKTSSATLELKRLGGAIDDKTTRISRSVDTIEKSLRTLQEIGDTTLAEHLLSSDGIIEAWTETDRASQLQNALRDEVMELKDTKEALTVDYSATEKKKAELLSLQKQLSNQKVLLDQNRAEQAALLTQTKNKESSYQKILADKQAAKAAFEKQLGDYEASLKYTLDPNAIPKAGSGVLSFPLDPAFMTRCATRVSVFGNRYCITQYFGNTEFAKGGAYNGQGHNGIDFGAPEGTKIVAALSGTVEGTGNTDLQSGCYSYGKWVLVRHTNGLATIYAHLSVISVSAGDSVGTGSLIGYSGKTGYATGPHLHFGLYVGSAVKIVKLGDVKVKTNCANVYMPVAPTEAYLDSMKYL